MSTSAAAGKARIGGAFKVTCRNPDGSIAWEDEFHNAINNTALNDVLDVYLSNGTQKSTWYVGLINNSPSPTLAATDTISSHSGWSEFTSYSEANRVTWTDAGASSQTITNSASAAAFTISATGTLYGAFLVSENTKSGTSGVLFATGAFSSTQAVVNLQSVEVTYACTAANA